jgi:hypothetical protein
MTRPLAVTCPVCAALPGSRCTGLFFTEKDDGTSEAFYPKRTDEHPYPTRIELERPHAARRAAAKANQ